MFGNNMDLRVGAVEREVADVKQTLNTLEERTNSIEVNQGKIMSGMETSKWFIIVMISLVTVGASLVTAFLPAKQQSSDVDLDTHKQIWLMEQRLQQLEPH